ncbi:copper amine oxidase N-terminal domain-containing protein [Biomaibacter acetigenes]|uniref:copper amine oxidase N-terminal domain-containing protein n=1 Tax=Biomaibacter acetigenes TaxID=2316383 RepID=UPI0011C499AA|nr:copper amine oxidase N-terminal domain-containing protein [Biomaibacter acetigenes]
MRIKNLFILLLVMTFIFSFSFNSVQVFAHDNTTKVETSTGNSNGLNEELDDKTDEEEDEDLDENDRDDEDEEDKDDDQEDVDDLDEGQEYEDEEIDLDEGLEEQDEYDKNLDDKEIKIKIDDGKVKIEIEDGEEIELETEKGKDPEKIIGELEQKLKENPNDEKALIKLALVYKSLGNYDQVIDMANKALSIDPQNHKAMILLAQSYESKGDVQSAISYLEELLKVNPDAKVQAYLAILNEKEGNLEKALKNMEEAIQKEPEDDGLYNEIGKLYEEMGLEGIKLLIKGQKVESDVKPLVKGGTTLVPVRIIVENLGAKVDWNQDTGSIIITKNGKTIELSIGSREVKINGVVSTIDEPATILEGRTVVPLRFISESFGTKVNWNSQYQIITVNEPAQ